MLRFGNNNAIGNARNALAAATFMLAPVGAQADTAMTAGVVMEKMPVGERASYITGIIEGLAYARFRKDTVAAGKKDEAGSGCIYGWFYKDTRSSFDKIEATFKKYADQYPATLLAAMIKKECGE